MLVCIPEINLPDYPFFLKGLGAMVYDPIVGVVRACGGEYTNKHSEKTTTDQCFQYDGIEWKNMPEIKGNIFIYYLTRSLRLGQFIWQYF